MFFFTPMLFRGWDVFEERLEMFADNARVEKFVRTLFEVFAEGDLREIQISERGDR